METPCPLLCGEGADESATGLLCDSEEERQRRPGLPRCAVHKQAQKLFDRELDSTKSSIADYCGPCHILAILACSVLLASVLAGILCGKLLKVNWLWSLLLLQPLSIFVVWLQWRCLRYVVLPWQGFRSEGDDTNFVLPILLIKVPFVPWIVGVSLVTWNAIVSLQTQAVLLGHHIQMGEPLVRCCPSAVCCIATLPSLLWATIWSIPKQCQKVRWDFDRNRVDDENKEIRYEALAYPLCWEGTHYEALVRYSYSSCMKGIQDMTISLPEAQVIKWWYTEEGFELKCSRRVLMVMRFNLGFVVTCTFFRTTLQVCAATWQWHNSFHLPNPFWDLRQWPWPLCVSLLNFTLVDCHAFLAAENVYHEFRSAHHEWGEEYPSDCKKYKDYLAEWQETMRSTQMYRRLRWLAFSLCTLIITACLRVILADLLCRRVDIFGWACASSRSPMVLVIVMMLTLGVMYRVCHCMLRDREETYLAMAPRPNGAKQYVDEDATMYYLHVPGQKGFTKMAGPQKGMEFEHRGSDEGDTFLRVPKGEPFQDSKLLRVQERGQQGDLPSCSRQRREELLGSAKQEDWFELAFQLGQELTPWQWQQERARNPKHRMVKLSGFDGRQPITSDYVSKAKDLLIDGADTVIWDGDWYHEEGWTAMIRPFLAARDSNRAVAFQKRAEVPGFHRSYWKLYQDFPNRVSIVVLSDKAYTLPHGVQEQLDWLEHEFCEGRLTRPATWEDDDTGYLKRALVARTLQGLSGVIAMGGGKNAILQASIEALDPNHPKPCTWWVFPAYKKRKATRDRTATEHGPSLADFAGKHANKYLLMGPNQPATSDSCQ